MRTAGDYYDKKAKEARELSEEIARKQAERYALQIEIRKLKARLEQARFVGD